MPDRNIIDLDALSAQELLTVLQHAAGDCFPRDRDQFVASCPLVPGSLVGSYFRAPDPLAPDAEALWLEGDELCSTIEGLVVGDPHSTSMMGVYLVEFFGRDGARGRQQLIELERMVEQHWLFFDDKGWLDSWSPVGQPAATVKDALAQEHGT